MGRAPPLRRRLSRDLRRRRRQRTMPRRPSRSGRPPAALQQAAARDEAAGSPPRAPPGGARTSSQNPDLQSKHQSIDDLQWCVMRSMYFLFSCSRGLASCTKDGHTCLFERFVTMVTMPSEGSMIVPSTTRTRTSGHVATTIFQVRAAADRSRARVFQGLRRAWGPGSPGQRDQRQ